MSIFESKFMSTTFQDAKESYKDPAFAQLAPQVVFALSQRVPISKPRLDTRQGTIDQDPEFIAFLQSQTEPVVKPQALDSSAEKSQQKVLTTPLIEALREKKASRAKATSKNARAKNESVKDEKIVNKSATPAAARNAASAAAKAQAVTKAASSASAAKITAKSSPASPATATKAVPTGPAQPTRRPGRAPAGIRGMLERDLGLAPKRPARAAASSSTATTPTASSATQTNNDAKPVDGTATATLPKRNVTPIVKLDANKSGSLLSASAGSTARDTTTLPASVARPSKASAGAPSDASKAFLRQVNAGQGITEQTIREAFTTFGQVSNVDVDKRKSTAVVTFATNEALKAALAKRSLTVAQGVVDIQTFRDKPPASSARGGPAGRGAARGRGRGGGSVRGVSATAAPAKPNSAVDAT